MHLAALRVSNFRRLQSVVIDLDKDISILVGANNSGKTSTAHLLQLFVDTAQSDAFTIHDFNAASWPAFNQFGEAIEGASLPKISVDLWLNVGAEDLYRVIELLPGLSWQGSRVGLRIEYTAKDPITLLAKYQEAKATAAHNAKPAENGVPAYHPSPRTMTEYLTDGTLREAFELRYHVLDHAQFNKDYEVQTDGYAPQRLFPDNGVGGRQILGRLIRVDVLNAQRHLSDSSAGNRAEDLSRHLGRFYNRNLLKREDDHQAIRALSASEALLNEHLSEVFKDTLERLNDLGYPGFANPKLVIKSALNPATLMNANDGGTKVFYVLTPEDGESINLPDRYNGLGFKNLIYIVIELLDRHSQWMDTEVDRPPLHLVFIEEPEVHLHAQLQQVFIRKIQDLLKLEGEDAAVAHTQLVVSTHSPHILYEGGFKPIRYFRRSVSATVQTSEVLNLSSFYNATDPKDREFLERYLKLTHCDLFFSDAALLVEGNVERLLMPLMVEKSAPRLRSACLCVLEVGGAFAYRFRKLIEFLGIATLVVTDLDSVTGSADGVIPVVSATASTADSTDAPTPPDEEEEEKEDDEAATSGKACMVHEDGAVTSNQTLIQWLPAQSSIAALLEADDAARTQLPSENSLAAIRVVYQNSVGVTWKGETATRVGRTLEEAFALQNLDWTQSADRSSVSLRIRGNGNKTLAALAGRIHKRVKASSFKKTDFALALLGENPNGWAVPRYIDEGLKWLDSRVMPAVVDADPTIAADPILTDPVQEVAQ